MNCKGLDLTIEGALSDPVIGAMMRADRVEPSQLEASLRATARRLEITRRAPKVPQGAVIQARRHAGCVAFSAW